jgi:hypothetical protein
VNVEPNGADRPASPAVHHLYGIRIRTPWPVAGVPSLDGAWDVEFVEGEAAMLAAAAAHLKPAQLHQWSQGAALPDGSSYRRWTGLVEFLVTPDARRIYARTLDETNREALLAYLLVDALSYSMVRLGWEPLHATAVLTDRGAVAFVGESGFGKSTLGALFVRNGFRLVTDDMLVLTPVPDGYRAHAGPPRLKLYRGIANRIFGGSDRGVPMNAVTEKMIIPLDQAQTVRDSTSLRAVYLIRKPDGRHPARSPFIRRLSPARAFPRILAATAGHYPFERERLTRQFEFVTQLVARIPIKTLSYPRDEHNMDRLQDAVLADLNRPVP